MSTGPQGPPADSAQAGCSDTETDLAAAPAASPPDLAPGPDPTVTLAAPTAASLPPHFPGQDQGTGLVLDGTDGALRVHWRLEPDDLEGAGGNFPPAGPRPTPVVRLRRARPDGGSDPVDEVGLRAEVREGAGATRFQVAADHARYFAELGLTSGDGGWLMLARSNALDNVSRVGVELARLDKAPREPPALPEPPPPASAVPPSVAPSPVVLTSDDEEPALTPTAPGRLASQFPLTERPRAAPWVAAAAPATPGPAPWHGPSVPAAAGGTEGLHLILGLPPLDPEFPLPTEAAPAARQPDGRGAPVGQRALEGRPLRLPVPGEPGEGPDQAAAPPTAEVLAPAPAPTGPDRIGADWTLEYGQAPLRRAGLEVEVKLLICGQAAPGSLVDLFGHPFRVGPGGRFQLVVRVDDESLVRQALFLNPPPELSRTRDD